ncbi:unnamed protein product [Didymodactylos carnosus]|uniref:Uncharacterized protein n=1 Tax=Didymodactylos carnosus TaxID=1234261 RepID=A0A814G1R0_9BILA|nr:unnamed protein product [Didymodactylos carnosus]CAF1280282.1 unnamed protein product [Didymodactylos carnosus]CAF3762514.1 unnamed protein product [Didymodactylos carnosus]CAF4085117.1 unnamed protein product [Didymodactylos carnosus]
MLTVYRGQFVHINELEKFKLNIRNLISMNTFLSTTTNKDVALIFAGDGDNDDDISINDSTNVSINKVHVQGTKREFCRPINEQNYLKFILFQMDIPIQHSLTTKSYADISKFSYMKGENEILLDTGSIFRIVSVDKLNIDHHHIWQMKLLFSEQKDKHINNLMNYIVKNEMNETANLLIIENVLIIWVNLIKH